MGKKQWLHDRQFIGLWILFKGLQTNCNRFKQTNWIRKPWFKTTKLILLEDLKEIEEQ